MLGGRESGREPFAFDIGQASLSLSQSQKLNPPRADQLDDSAHRQRQPALFSKGSPLRRRAVIRYIAAVHLFKLRKDLQLDADNIRMLCHVQEQIRHWQLAVDICLDSQAHQFKTLFSCLD